MNDFFLLGLKLAAHVKRAAETHFSDIKISVENSAGTVLLTLSGRSERGVHCAVCTVNDLNPNVAPDGLDVFAVVIVSNALVRVVPEGIEGDGEAAAVKKLSDLILWSTNMLMHRLTYMTTNIIEKNSVLDVSLRRQLASEHQMIEDARTHFEEAYRKTQKGGA